MSEITKYFSLASTSRTDETTKNTSSSSSDEIETPQSKRAHIVKNRSFSVEWLDEPLFEGWLMECDGKPKCKCCNVSLSAKKSDLIKHANTNKHKISSQKIANTKTLNVLFKQQNITKDIMIADLKYTLLVVSHNFSFNSVQHIVNISKSVFKDSSLSGKVKLSRTKCSSIVTNVLSPVICDNLRETMKNKLFSVLVDESTDISNTRVLCILVRFINGSQGLTTQILDCIKIGADEGTAKGLFLLFNKAVNNFNLKYENIVGYCSDNTSVMMGVKESFKTHLLNKNENIVVSGCICHSAHLVVSAASEVLPSNIESLLQNIYAYFSRSPKRQSILEEFQNFFRKEKHKILAPAKTRWLSLSKCVERVLKQWDVLAELFKVACFEDKNSTAQIIYNEFQNPFVKAYFEFLLFILPLFNEFNSLFQSSKVLFPIISKESKRFIRQLCGNFIKPELLSDNSLFTSNFEHPHSLLPLEEIQFGLSEQTTALFGSLDNGDVQQFKFRCLSFYQKAATDSVRRFPVKETWMDYLDFVEPTNIFNYKFNENSVKNIKMGLKKFKHIGDDNLAFSGILKIQHYFSSEEKKMWEQKSVVSFGPI
ncbi:zinc finger MYM-type protein 6-like [Leptinotarsa decemlineata]|uniref:zinc finger MYM-type protein 6-like n=1 Tax=Leptinotarsa decemlineata TaxID=7539 RepID=UPI003D30D106